MLVQKLSMFLFFFLLVGCSVYKGATSQVDLFLYKNIGYTLFSSPSFVDIKQIHLGRVGNLQEKVLVRGKVSEVNKLGTYLLLSQHNVKLVIDLSQLSLVRQEFAENKPEYLEVVGEVERSFKGMPFVKALALRPIEKSEF